MYAHHTKKVLYLAHPHTASMAVATALKEQAGFDNTHHHHGDLEMAKDRGIPVDDSWMVLTTIRNHWDTIASYHAKNHKSSRVIKIDWLRSHLAGNKYIRNGRLFALHYENANRILRYETLQSDLNFALLEADLPPVTLHPVNVSSKRNGRPYWTYYDEETRDLVAEFFADEITELGYSFRSPEGWPNLPLH